jgi:hypothetical protein
MHRRMVALGFAVALASAACADDGPTGLGSNLIPGEVRTFELLLDAAQFLENDTSMGGFIQPGHVNNPYLVANQFGGVVNAHLLLRFEALPTSIQYEDEDGETRTDAEPSFVGGSLVLPIDTLSVRSGGGTATVRLSTIGQNWAPGVATWEIRRRDDDGEDLPWSVPGGTPGDLVFEAEWDVAADSIVIPVDSQAVATIFDQESGARGVLIQLSTGDARFRVLDEGGTSPVFRVDAVPSADPEASATVDVALSANPRPVFDAPEPDLAPGELRAGGLGGWRTTMQLKERLDTLTVTLPGVSEGGQVRLRDLTISMAALVLEALPVPTAFEPEDTVGLEPRVLLVSENKPPGRAPVGGAVAVPHVIDPDIFTEGGERRDVSIPLTRFVSNLTRRRSDEDDPPASSLALISLPQAGTVGYGAFAGTSSPEGSRAARPRLRILVTTVDNGGVR